MNKKNKGFTLIELLVVIAIIGILSGLIIVSLGDATNQAKEAKIKSALDQVRAVAQMHYNTTGTGNFSGLDNNAKIINIFTEIENNGGTTKNDGIKVSNDNKKWCAYSKTIAGNCMCVDSTGRVKEGTTIDACSCDANTACP